MIQRGMRGDRERVWEKDERQSNITGNRVKGVSGKVQLSTQQPPPPSCNQHTSYSTGAPSYRNSITILFFLLFFLFCLKQLSSLFLFQTELLKLCFIFFPDSFLYLIRVLIFPSSLYFFSPSFSLCFFHTSQPFFYTFPPFLSSLQQRFLSLNHESSESLRYRPFGPWKQDVMHSYSTQQPHRV